MKAANAEPSRIKIARQRRRQTISRLAADVGVTARTVSRWENGESAPSPEMVQRLSRTLSFPESFFLGSLIEELPEKAASFRGPSKMSASLKDSALAAGMLGVHVSQWMRARFALPEPDVPTLTGYDPEVAASVVRQRWDMGIGPIRNVLHLLESRGIVVFSLPKDVLNVDAFCFYNEGLPYIYVSTTKTAERQRFDLAHELGHLVLHGEEGNPVGRAAEQEAHLFASSFLMPKEDLLGFPLHNADVATIIAAKARWGVSAMALAHRLHRLGFISEWVYRDSCISLAQAGYRRGEPNSSLVPETSQILHKVFSALRTRRIGLVDLAQALNLSMEELSEYLFGLVPLAVNGEGPSSRPSGELRLIMGGHGVGAGPAARPHTRPGRA